MLIIGIDPGISGAICFFENDQVNEIIDMPTMADGKKIKGRSMDRKYLMKYLVELKIYLKKMY